MRRELLCWAPASPPQVQIRAGETPQPRRGQVLVRVEATSVNPIDAKRASGYGQRLLGLKGAARPPLRLGNDLAGRVEALATRARLCGRSTRHRAPRLGGSRDQRRHENGRDRRRLVVEFDGAARRWLAHGNARGRHRRHRHQLLADAPLSARRGLQPRTVEDRGARRLHQRGAARGGGRR